MSTPLKGESVFTKPTGSVFVSGIAVRADERLAAASSRSSPRAGDSNSGVAMLPARRNLGMIRFKVRPGSFSEGVEVFSVSALGPTGFLLLLALVGDITDAVNREGCWLGVMRLYGCNAITSTAGWARGLDKAFPLDFELLSSVLDDALGLRVASSFDGASNLTAGEGERDGCAGNERERRAE